MSSSILKKTNKNNQLNDSIDNTISDQEEYSDDSKIPEEDINFNPLTFFKSKELCFYKMIDKFYKNCDKDNITRMVDIINSDSKISLRILDWFVTRYSKTIVTDNDKCDIHISYKSQLKSYKKIYFDPFRRRKKFFYHFNIEDKDIKIYTTLGQLNFFMWAINNNIIDFVQDNFDLVINEMNNSNKEDKKRKEKKKNDKVKNNNSQNNSVDSNNNNSIKIQANKFIEEDEINIILRF